MLDYLKESLAIEQEMRLAEQKQAKRLNHNTLVDNLLKERRIIFYNEDFYEYKEGCYKLISVTSLKEYVRGLLKDNFSSHYFSEVVCSLQGASYIKSEDVNTSKFLNLKNGLFEIESQTLNPHTDAYYSTVQLGVNYNPEAKCEKWKKTLDEIFEGRKDKIEIVQEFFGLCFTKETRYEKALFLIGEGSNGKSVILHVLKNLLSKENYCSMPLEKFCDMHYIAGLHNRLANISIETNAKSTVYDSIFKAVISGDSLTSDRKYGQPFTFEPFCKLIFALNNMPRVDDKTDAFFRRLLIVRFDRQFTETEQNKTLRDELVTEELDGIFNWCIEGLKRLKARSYFDVNIVKEEVESYRRENNNVMLFVDERCELDPDFMVGVDELYQAYSKWCSENGHKGQSKIRFGKDLKKQYPKVSQDRTGISRNWIGIGLPTIPA